MDDVELEVLLNMTKEERQLFLLGQDVTDESQRLDVLIWEYQVWGEEIAHLKQLAKKNLMDYNEHKRDIDLLYLEQNTKILKSFTNYRGVVREEIKEQRERVRWSRAQQNKMRRSLSKSD